MKIEALEDIKSDRWDLTQGDFVTVPDDVGANWCARGWASDCAGLVPTGNRVVLNARVTVIPAIHSTDADQVGG